VGAAFALRWPLYKSLAAGRRVERLWLVGGATRSSLWPQILADASGLPFSVTGYAHWPALGAAILAGVGAGVFDTAEAGQARFQKPAREVLPEAANRAMYDERFAAYQQAAQLLAQIL
jgi:L-xylulokinase